MHKRSPFFLLLLAVFSGIFSVQARRPRAAQQHIITPSVDPAIAQLADQYRDIDMVVEKAKRDAAQVQREAERTVVEANNRAERRQSRMSRRKEEILRRERERKAVAERKARERAERIRKEAEAESLRIIQDAEKRALDLRNKLEAQEQYDRANSKPAITSEWQREVQREFASDSAFMKQIIIEGETSRLEKQDFIALFDEQEKWFVEQVNDTEHFFDESYKAVMRKKNALAVLVDAQRQADELLAELVHEHHLSDEAHQQLRVAALYEINDYLQREDKREVFIASDVVRTLVATVAEQAVPGYKTVKITTEKEEIEKLEQRVAELEGGYSEGPDDAGQDSMTADEDSSPDAIQ
ncbi:MAG: hypothetical protein PVJ92_03515, partial [Candidatus Dependentiae bacterium]